MTKPEVLKSMADAMKEFATVLSQKKKVKINAKPK
jgi:hypothetical protein